MFNNLTIITDLISGAAGGVNPSLPCFVFSVTSGGRSLRLDPHRQSATRRKSRFLQFVVYLS